MSKVMNELNKMIRVAQAELAALRQSRPTGPIMKIVVQTKINLKRAELKRLRNLKRIMGGKR